MSRVDLQEVASELSKIVSELCRRRSISGGRKAKEIASYLRNAAALYEADSYLPQVPPVFASNFTYMRLFYSNRLTRELERLSASLGDLAPVDDSSGSLNAVQVLLTGTILLCTELPRSEIPEARFRIGDLEVGPKGYCSLMSHAHMSGLIVASYHYVFHAAEFIEESLKNFIEKTTIRECSPCISLAARGGGMEYVRRFRTECPECFEKFRQRLTSRPLPAFRGLLSALYGLKWLYHIDQASGYQIEGIIVPVSKKTKDKEGSKGGGGIRLNYSVTPTLLGRIVAHSIETWAGRIPDYRLISTLSQTIHDYLKLFREFREEARIIAERGGRSSVYELESVLNWLASVRKLVEAEPSLILVAPADLGSVVDDLVNYAVNERIHWYASTSFAPEASRAFTWFQGINVEQLIIRRVVQPR